MTLFGEAVEDRPVVNRSIGAQAGLPILWVFLHHSVGPLVAALARFNNRTSSASAHDFNPLDGTQPYVRMVDDDDVAWAQVNGNWPRRSIDGVLGGAISIENESLPYDVPETPYDDVWAPLNPAQLERVARRCAWLHVHRGFPLQVSDDPSVPGLVYHSMNPPAWGITGCPGQPIVDQRPEIIARAIAILAGTPEVPLVPIIKEPRGMYALIDTERHHVALIDGIVCDVFIADQQGPPVLKDTPEVHVPAAVFDAIVAKHEALEARLGAGGTAGPFSFTGSGTFG